MAFSALTALYNHISVFQRLGIAVTPNGTSARSQSLPFPLPQPQKAAKICFLSTQSYLFWVFYVSRIVQFVTLFFSFFTEHHTCGPPTP